MKLYLSGPVTGYEKGNRPAFDAAQRALNKAGHLVLSPFDGELPEVTTETLADHYGAKYWQVLAEDVSIILSQELDALALLPGWEKSKGARIEAFVGLVRGVKFYEYTNESLSPPLNPEYVAGIVAAQWMPEPVRRVAAIMEGRFPDKAIAVDKAANA